MWVEKCAVADPSRPKKKYKRKEKKQRRSSEYGECEIDDETSEFQERESYRKNSEIL